MQPATGVGGTGKHPGVGEVGVVERPALEEADGQHPKIRPVLDDRRTHARFCRGRGVEMLVVAVDSEQAGVAL